MRVRPQSLAEIFRAMCYTCLVTTALGLLTAAARADLRQPMSSDYVLELEPFATHTGTNAIDLTHATDQTGRIFVSTQSGQVFAFDHQGNSLGIFLDLAKDCPDFALSPGGAFRGLMYIAFHPDYAKPGTRGQGLLYTGHQVQPSNAEPDDNSKDHGAMGDSDVRFVVAQWRVAEENPNRVDPSSYRHVLMLNFHTTASNPHAVGELAFNPYAKPSDTDYGHLYISIGDSNNRNESGQTNLAYTQRTDNLFAKILRIDPLGSGGRSYSVPVDNPFNNAVYALGLRNSQSFSFAKDLNGDPIIVAFDMGAADAEEINLVRSGQNYGWDRFEGTASYDADRVLHSPARPPVAQYGHAFPTRPGEEPRGGPAAIIGGFVVTDPDDPGFQGQIIFADLPRGTFMHVNYHHALMMEQDGRQSLPYVMQVRLGEKIGTFADVIGADRADVRFGVDEAGTLYLVSKQTDTIFKTSLVYTGKAIETTPKLQKDLTFSGTRGLVITVGSVAAALIFMLVIFARGGKRSTPHSYDA